MNQEELAQLQTFLGSAQSILILAGGTPTHDSLGASLALYLAFSRSGKNSTVACLQPPTVGLSNLVGVDKIQNDLGGQNLIVSFPYVEGSIEKVSYNIEDNKFNLVIQPRGGARPLSSNEVKFLHGGASADLIFILGALDLLDLGHFYEKEKDLYHKVPSVVLDHRAENKRYGKINFVNPQASSTSEIVGSLLTRLGMSFDPDIAHNLLSGIDFATRNFSLPQTSVEAFEVAAACLRAGAQRVSGASSVLQENREFKKPVKGGFPFPAAPKSQPEEAPADWLTPKIFKGSNLP